MADGFARTRGAHGVGSMRVGWIMMALALGMALAVVAPGQTPELLDDANGPASRPPGAADRPGGTPLSVPSSPRLVTALDDTSAMVSGPHFELRWSAAAGGDLVSIRLDDGIVWHEMLDPMRLRRSVPGLHLISASGDYWNRGGAILRWLEQGPARVVLETVSTPTTLGGAASPWRFRQQFTVDVAGAIFVDFELELPPEAPSERLERASIGLPLATERFAMRRWHWRRDADRGEVFLEAGRTFTASRCPDVGVALGNGGAFTNQVQFVLEGQEPLGGAGGLIRDVGVAVADGSYFIYHLRPGDAGPVLLDAPFVYRNRCGLLLGRSPQHDALIGQRLVYWEEGGESGMAYPSPSALEAMVQCGASGVVLGEGWRRAEGGEGNVPVDDAAMRRMIGDAHAMGLGVIAYTLADGDPLELAAWAQELGLDGLYLDQASPHFGRLPEGGSDHPVRAAFEWACRLRTALGPESMLIAHDGLRGPDLSMSLVLPGVVFGLDLGDLRAASDLPFCAYMGGQGYGIPCPLALELRLHTARALAHYAATSSVPLVPLGYGSQRSAFQAARWALPLWQIYRTLPMGRDVRALRGASVAYVGNTNPAFVSRLYGAGDGAFLVASSNLGQARVDSTTLEVDFAALGIGGSYAIEEVRSLGLEAIESVYLGRSMDGVILSPPMSRWGLRGYLFVDGDYPPAIGRALDEIAQVGLAFADTRAPNPPAAPVVRADGAALRVDWEASRDRHHVEAYRIFRSPTEIFDAAHVVDLGVVYETTTYRDLGVAPGEEAFYSISAIDQAENESPPSASAGGRLPAAAVAVTFADSAEAERFRFLSGSWTIHDGGLEHGRTPDATRFARALLRDPTFEDVDLRVRIESPGGYRYAGGIVFRTDDAGNGYALFLDVPAHGRLVLAALEGGEERRIAEAHYPYVTRDGCLRSLRVVARGTHIVASCDGQALIDVEDGTFRRGRVGLTALMGHVRFDNLAVDRPGAREP